MSLWATRCDSLSCVQSVMLLLSLRDWFVDLFSSEFLTSALKLFLLSGQFQVVFEMILIFYCMSTEVTLSKSIPEYRWSFFVTTVWTLLKASLALAHAFTPMIRGTPHFLLRPLLLHTIFFFLFPRCLALFTASLRVIDNSEQLQIPEKRSRSSKEFPLTVVIIPCYNERLEILLESIRSIGQLDYPENRIHVFFSFDGVANLATYRQTLEILGATENHNHENFCAEVQVGNSKLTLSLFPHGGKVGSQDQTIEYMRKNHAEYFTPETYALMLDADTIIHRGVLKKLANRMQFPGPRDGNLKAVSAYVGVHKANSFLDVIQESEQLHHNLFDFARMSYLGNAACLSGTCIYTRFDDLLAIWGRYADLYSNNSTIYEHWKHKFGDDRTLTNLFNEHFGKHATDVQTTVICETEAKSSLKELLMQRKRWALSTLATDSAALCNIKLWKDTPLLMSYRLLIQPFEVSEFQMIIPCVTIWWRQIPGFVWLPWTIALWFAAEAAFCFGFHGIRERTVGLRAYPVVIFAFPLIYLMHSVWTMLTIMERAW